MSQFGAAPLEVRVFGVNALGAPLAGASVTLEVEGEPVEATVGADGLGTVTLETPGLYGLTDAGRPEGFASVHPVAWAGLGLDRAWTNPDDQAPRTAVAVDGGVAVATTTRLWIHHPTRAPVPILDLDLDDALVGLLPADLDDDGTTDLVAWSPRSLFLLRGRGDALFTWAGGHRGLDRALGGVAVGDPDGDGVHDLFVAWVDEARGTTDVEVWESDLLWSFDTAEVIPLSMMAGSLAVGVDADSGVHTLVALDLEGEQWRHLVQATGDEAEGWITLSDQLPLALPRGSRLLPAADITADRVDDILVAAPRADGVERALHVFDLDVEPTRVTTSTPTGAHVGLGRLDVGAAPELMTVDDAGTLRALTTPPDGQMVEATLGEMDAPGPPALLGAVTDTGVPPLLVAEADTWVRLRGDRADSGLWRHAPLRHDTLLTGVERLLDPPDLDGDSATREWAGLQVRDGERFAKAWSRAPGDETVLEMARWSLGEATDPVLDASWCGEHLWVLDPTTLIRIDLLDPAGPTEALAQAHGGGSAIDCVIGETPRVGLLDGDVVRLLTLGGVEVDTVDRPGAVDLALVPADTPDVEPEVVSCSADGCRTEAWDPTPGDWRSAWADAQESVLGPPVDARDVPGIALGSGGWVRTADVDGDGLDDLLTFREDGGLEVHRATTGGPGGMLTYDLGEPLSGPGLVRDMDGDGAMDLLFLDVDGDLARTTVAPGPTP